MLKQKNTIFALASGHGRAAIAIIRISGKQAIKNIKKISTNFPNKTNQIKINKILDRDKKTIDQTLTSVFKSPKSYTGEDMVEISTHGGGAIIKKIIKTLGNLDNFRLAEPGEFTRRAFENNKLDLTQVEAVADLINAETEAQRSLALNQLDGHFSKKTNLISKEILSILANVEAAIDFTDEELPDNLINTSKEQIRNIIKKNEDIFLDNNIGEKIRIGFIVTVMGKPNTGKSSFFNKIANRDISIVTNEPGTTRDVLEVFVEYRGLPIKFFDTAGIRRAKNKAEIIGVKKTHNLSMIADVNLVFVDKNSDMDEYNKVKNKIFIKSKYDKLKNIKKSRKIHYISSKSGFGINLLLKKIHKTIGPNKKIADINVSRERHRVIINKTLEYLKKSLSQKNIDLFAEDIRYANKEVSKISGNIDIEDILDIIFNDFCIGK